MDLNKRCTILNRHSVPGCPSLFCGSQNQHSTKSKRFFVTFSFNHSKSSGNTSSNVVSRCLHCTVGSDKSVHDYVTNFFYNPPNSSLPQLVTVSVLLACYRCIYNCYVKQLSVGLRFSVLRAFKVTIGEKRLKRSENV